MQADINNHAAGRKFSIIPHVLLRKCKNRPKSKPGAFRKKLYAIGKKLYAVGNFLDGIGNFLDEFGKKLGAPG